MIARLAQADALSKAGDAYCSRSPHPLGHSMELDEWLGGDKILLPNAIADTMVVTATSEAISPYSIDVSPRPPSYSPMNFTRRKLNGAKEANCVVAQHLYASIVQGSE
jgi:hypothetical protein